MSGQMGDLVISISADMARFRADMGKAQQVTQTTMQQMQADVSRGVSGLQSSLASVSKGFAAVTAVAAGGAIFSSFISSTKEWNGEVMKLSKVMGMTVTDSSAYNTALRIAGVDQDTATATTAKLTKTLATNEDAFKRHSIAVRDSSGKLLPMTQIIGNTFEALGKLETGASRNTAAMELFGKSWVQLQSMAKLTNPLLAEARQLSDDLGLTLDGKTTEAVKKYGQEMNKLKLVHEGFKVMVGREVIGPLTEIEKQITKILAKDHALRDTITFMAHPFDFTRRQASFFTHPGERYPMPERPSAKGGEEYDPAKAAAEAAKKAEQEAAARMAAAAAAQKEVEYVKTYNTLQDERIKRQIQENIELTATQKKMEEIKLKYQGLIALNPGHQKELEKNLALDLQNEKVLGDRVDKLKMANIELKESVRLMEDLNKDTAGFGSYGQGLNVPFGLSAPKRAPYDFSGKPLPGGKFSLTGASESSFFGGKSGEVEQSQAEKDELLKIQRQFNADMFSMKLEAANQTLGIAKTAAGDNKVLLLTVLAAETAISVSRIMQAEAVALMNAKAGTAILGPAGDEVYAAQAAEITSMAGMNIGLAAAGGLMQAVQIAGKRASGGPVRGGETYLVGEKGPELFTAGTSGNIMPNNQLGGGGPVIYATIDARGADQGVEQKIRAGMQQAVEAAYSKVKRSMDRGGEMALASGRMR